MEKAKTEKAGNLGSRKAGKQQTEKVAAVMLDRIESTREIAMNRESDL
jgi:hypothetical protein